MTFLQPRHHRQTRTLDLMTAPLLPMNQMGWLMVEKTLQMGLQSSLWWRSQTACLRLALFQTQHQLKPTQTQAWQHQTLALSCYQTLHFGLRPQTYSHCLVASLPTRKQT